MTASPEPNPAAPRRGAGALAALVFLVALNLRPPITAVGPLLPELGADLGLTTAAQGLLGALPLLAFGAVSPLVHLMARRFGADRSMFIALIVMAAGTLIRSYTGEAGLWIGTIILGSAIAVGNVLMPPLVKRDYGRNVSFATGIYTACINISAGLASSLAVPIAQVSGWQGGLAFWALPALVVAVFWIARLRAPAAPPKPPRQAGVTTSTGRWEGIPLRSVWRQPTGWLLTSFMALQSTGFYFVVTWLPTIEAIAGVSAAQSGVHLLIYQAIGVVTGLVFPRFMRRADSQVGAAVGAGLPLLAGVLGLMIAPQLGMLWAFVMGVGSSASFVVVLSLISLRGRTTHETTRLSGMVQSIGYFGAAAGPVVAGVLAQQTGSWTASLTMLAVIVTLQVIVAGLSGRVPADRR